MHVPYSKTAVVELLFVFYSPRPIVAVLAASVRGDLAAFICALANELFLEAKLTAAQSENIPLAMVILFWHNFSIAIK